MLKIISGSMSLSHGAITHDPRQPLIISSLCMTPISNHINDSC